MDISYRQLLNAAPDAMLVVDRAGRMILTNTHLETMFGYSREELDRQPVEVLLPGAFRDRHRSLTTGYFDAPKRRPMGQGLALFGARKDGTEFPVDVTLSPLQSDGVEFVAAAVRDMTRRHALSEKRFRAIFEQRHQLAGIVDLDGIVVDANERALAFSGLDLTDVVGRPFWETGWWRHDAALQTRLRAAVERAAAGETVAFEATHPRPDGTLATVDFSLRPVTDAQGEVVFLVPESHDITQRKNAEAALIAANEGLEQRVLERVADVDAARQEAEHANAGKSRFLAAASHDLRQPLQSLGMYLSVLTGLLDQPEQIAVADRMHASLRSMSELLDALLDISKFDRGIVVPAKKDLLVQTLLDRIVADNEQQAQAKGLQLNCVETDCVVHSDPGLLERVLENFVTNAIRYTERGSVRIHCEAQDGVARISVTDTGIGIAAGDLDKVFDEYYQLDNPVRDRRKGLGLGLAIVRHIARLLDHPLDVRSAPGEGSTFAVTVPLGQATAVELRATSPVDANPGREPVVLFVDDDRAIVDATSMLLQSVGLKVHTALCGHDALAHVDAGVRPDVLVSDFRLPDFNGAELIRRVRAALGEALPTVIMTGDTLADAGQAAALPNCTILHKPVDTERLLHVIRSAGS